RHLGQGRPWHRVQDRSPPRRPAASVYGEAGENAGKREVASRSDGTRRVPAVRSHAERGNEGCVRHYEESTPMLLRNIHTIAIVTVLLGIVSPAAAQQPDLDDLRQQAVKAAARKVGQSVVQIQTSGGTDIIGTGPRGAQVRKGMGPTTGVILTADGYIAS